ncbi:hypothetical protein MRS44_003700 [Fusarium solani]|uniref:uncharacterized protein n=1 Tax=Fusarium solani TaxID=169388 RepID=UPI0032C42277|nr:hypothetical protein MRS44_003700 [Fusarium solani]
MAPSAIIIGAGPSGIAMAHKMKHELGFNDFIIYEKMDGVGGTWRANNYPGCGCDVHSHLYSFSFNLNPNWSKQLAEQGEILEYIEDTVDKFQLRPHINLSVECLGAQWHKAEGQWHVKLRDLQTDITFVRQATMFISAVGGISMPRDVHFNGMESFRGPMFHTARWRHDVSYEGKRVVVPAVAEQAASVTQYARSPQWYHARPNRRFTGFEKFCFRGTKAGVEQRLKEEETARRYIFEQAPKKYHDILVPTFELGCKRKIADPGYLVTLHRDNVELIPEGIQKITEDGIVSSSGRHDQYDMIVMATGFKVTEFLTPMEIIGADGNTLDQQWKESRGAQAYLGTFVHNFPNMAIIFGPNTFPANNSALYACEVQVSYAAEALVKPLIDGQASVIEVKEAVENYTTNQIHQKLKSSVFSGDCSNWYIGDYGRNVASWPGLAIEFWIATLFPDKNAFVKSGGSRSWLSKGLVRNVRQYGGIAAIVAAASTLPVYYSWMKL